MVRVLLSLCLLWSLGCAQDGRRVADASWSRFKPKMPDPAPDLVELHYIFIERDEGNPLLNQTIWAEADEQAIPLDKRQSLAENGLRLGKLGSRLSPEILKLLEKSNAQGEGRRHIAHSGGLAKVQTTDVRPKMSLFTVAEGQPRGEELADAQCYMHVTPVIESGHDIRLQIVPEIEFGQRKNRRTPAPDLSGWQIRNDRDARSFPDLKVELSLNSGEYALLGGLPDRRGTVGACSFTQEQNSDRKQTVLLIRVVRPTRDELYSAGYDLDDFFLGRFKKPSSPSRSSVGETLLSSRRGAPLAN